MQTAPFNQKEQLTLAGELEEVTEFSQPGILSRCVDLISGANKLQMRSTAIHPSAHISMVVLQTKQGLRGQKGILGLLGKHAAVLTSCVAVLKRLASCMFV